jgi:nucleotide-binding universal stress UspA family protein
MEKILIALDATNPSANTLELGCYLTRLTHSRATVVLLENEVAEEQMVLKKEQGMHYVDWEVKRDSPAHVAKQKIIIQNIERLKESCSNRGVNFFIHHDRGEPAEEVISESRYADLLVMDPELTFTQSAEDIPTSFTKKVLSHAECPVILSASETEGVDEIIVTYTDSRSSVYALKQFAYLFPALKDKKLTVLHINEKEPVQLEDRTRLMEWVKNHFGNSHYEELPGNSSEELLNYCIGRKNIMIVMGAYGRGVLSSLFKQSHANTMLKMISQPIFITHI